MKADEELIIFTDNIPPYTYQNSSGEFVGTADKRLKQIMDHAKIKYHTISHPWKRAHKQFKQTDDALIFPISRRPNREHNYLWLAPLFKIELKLFGLKARFKNKEIDISTGKYQFVCVDITIICTALKELGIPESSINTINSVNAKQMIKMVNAEHVDFVFLPEDEFNFALSDLGLSKMDYFALENYSYVMVDYLVAEKDFNTKVAKKIIDSASKFPLID